MSDVRRLAAATLLAAYRGREVPAWLLRRVDDGLGGVCLFPGNDLATAPAMLHGARADVIVALDEEGGDVTRLHRRTGSPVPGNAALGAVDDVELTAAIARAMGAELRAAQIDLDLAPVADVNVDPGNPVIGTRSFGAEPALVSRHVAAFVGGLQAAGVAACVKHFPGHGDTHVDSHLALPVVVPELAPFRAAVDAGAASIMVGHLIAPSLADVAATYSRTVIVDVLRHQLGFSGAVVTDALEMGGAGGPAAVPYSVVRTLRAGADLCCLGAFVDAELVDACIDAVAGAVKNGELPASRLEDAVARIANTLHPISRRWLLDDKSNNHRQLGHLGEIGGEAARRALRVDPDLALPVQGAHVVELACEPTIASGPLPWGIADPLLAIDAAASAEQLADDSSVAPVLARATGRPLVIVVRDAHRHPAAAAKLAALLAARPDAVVVDMGWPVAPASITTFGASRASGEIVARLLYRGSQDDG